MSSEEVATSARFGGSAYRSKTSTFQKKSTDRKNRSSIPAGKSGGVSDGTPSTARSVASSSSAEFTLQDATSSFATNNSNGRMKSDLLAQLNLLTDDDDSNRDVSVYYNDSVSANSSFESGRMLRTPTRTSSSSSKNVSFDGSHLSPAAPPKRRSVNETPDRVGPVDFDATPTPSPFRSSGQLREWMNPSSTTSNKFLDEDSTSTRGSVARSVSIASVQSDEVTVHTANPPPKGGGLELRKQGPSPNLDETSVSSNMSAEIEAVRPKPTRESSWNSKEIVSVERSSTSNGHGVRTLNIILESSTVPTNGFPHQFEESGNGSATKPSWMTFSRVTSSGPSESKADETKTVVEETKSHTDVPTGERPTDQESSVWNAMKPFTYVNMYQDPTELMPVLSMVESKRHCWFQNEMDAMRREWSYYKKLLRENVQEIIRVEEMLQSCFDSLVEYAHNIENMMNDVFLTDEGEVSSGKGKEKLLKQLDDRLAAGGADDETRAWLTPLRESFAKVKKEVDTQVPSLEECIFDATKLKYEMMMKGKDVEEQGNAITLRTVEQAEENIQTAFDDLLRVADACERHRGSDGAAPDSDVPLFINDRWLYESRYRHAAHLGLLTWKDSRKEYQQIYAKVIELNDERKSRLNEVLLSFLPRRKKLLKSVYVALMSGSEALEEGRISKSRENRAIEKAIEKNAVQALNDQPSPLCLTSVLPPTSNVPGKISNRDIWSSSFLKDRRLLEVKVAKDTWKSAIALITLDDVLQIILVGDLTADLTLPSDQRPTLLAVTQGLTEIPVPPEYSIPLADFDANLSSVDMTEVELVRRTRSKLFRKRDDQITVRLSTVPEAAKWVRTKLPRAPVQLAEI